MSCAGIVTRSSICRASMTRAHNRIGFASERQPASHRSLDIVAVRAGRPQVVEAHVEDRRFGKVQERAAQGGEQEFQAYADLFAMKRAHLRIAGERTCV